MPHCTVSNCSVSVETVMAGTVTTAHSRTWTIGPPVTCKTKQNPLRNKVIMLLIIKPDKDSIMWKFYTESKIMTIFVHMYILVCAHVYLYWHDNTYVPHLQVGSLGVKFNCESLCLTARKVFHSFKFCTETFEEATTTHSSSFLLYMCRKL